MNNGNNSLIDLQNIRSSNNRRNTLKTFFSVTINTAIISFFILHSIKHSKYATSLINENYNIINNNNNENSNDNLRNLDDDNIFTKVEKHFFQTKNKVVENEMKKYLNLLLEHLGSEFDSIRNFISGKPFIISKEAFFLEKQKQIFMSRLTKNWYNGTWEYFPYVPQEEDETKNMSEKYISYYLNSSSKSFKIGSYRNGTATFNFKKAIEMSTKQEAIALTMKNLEGNYIDNWIQHISYAKLNDLIRIIDNKNKLYILKGEYSSSMIKGKLLNSKKFSNKKMQCSTLIEMEFPLVYVTLQSTIRNKTYILKNISSIDPSHFTMLLSSNCGFRIKINAKIYDRQKEYYNIKQNISNYSYYCIFGSLLYLIGACFLTNSLNNNENAISAISIECYSQNIAWNLYCAISNINFGLTYYDFFGYFCVISLFPLLNFTIFDLRFLYCFWKIKKRVLNDSQFIKLRLRFFALFYSLLFISFFSITTFFTNTTYIIILSISIWTPQILHNIVQNNKYIYPTIYIITTTLYRIMFPFYFRGYESNFTYLKTDKFLLIILSSYILFTIIFIYLQAFLGPRFMLSSKYQKRKGDFHKTKEELLEERPNSKNEECVICLSQLFGEEENNNGSNKNNDIVLNVDIDKSESESSSDSPTELQSDVYNGSSQQKSIIDLMNTQIKQQNVSIKNNFENLNNNLKNRNIYKYNKMNSNNNSSLAINVKSDKNKNTNKFIGHKAFSSIEKILKVIFCESLFSFYKIPINLGEKKYMLIYCGHIFHSACLEKWFDRKKECPSCRASMEAYI